MSNWTVTCYTCKKKEKTTANSELEAVSNVDFQRIVPEHIPPDHIPTFALNFCCDACVEKYKAIYANYPEIKWVKIV